MNEIKPEIMCFLEKCGTASPEFLDRCIALMKLLELENEKYNLTSIGAGDRFWVKHICDSAAIFIFYGRLLRGNVPVRVCDIGSGAGFPALVIAMGSGSAVYAVESSHKKAAFIEKASKMLGLQNLFVLNARAEELNSRPEYAGYFNIVTSRAVGSARLISQNSSKLLSQDGCYILYKTPAAADGELADANAAPLDISWIGQNFYELPLGMGERLFLLGKRRGA